MAQKVDNKEQSREDLSFENVDLGNDQTNQPGLESTSSDASMVEKVDSHEFPISCHNTNSFSYRHRSKTSNRNLKTIIISSLLPRMMNLKRLMLNHVQ